MEMITRWLLILDVTRLMIPNGYRIAGEAIRRLGRRWRAEGLPGWRR
jgi:hypothetical protein